MSSKLRMDKVNVKALDEGLKLAKLNRLGTKEERIARLVAHVSKTPVKDRLECPICLGESTKEFEQCPFCGEGDEPEAKGKKTPSDKLAEVKAADAKNVQQIGRPKGWKAPATKEATPTPGAAIAKLTPAQQALAKFSVADLEKSVKEIAKLQSDAIRCTWELGHAIKDNYDKELWKLRADEKGAPKYTNVREFWRDEFGYSHTYCYQLMQIAETFTKEDVAKVGPTKLHLIMQAPEAAQPKLLESARKGGQTVDQLKKAVERIKNAGKGQSAGPSATEKKDRITLAVAPGRKTIPMYARPAKQGDDLKPAKKIEDQPFFEYELSNSVKMRVVISKNANGEIVAVTEFKRQ